MDSAYHFIILKIKLVWNIVLGQKIKTEKKEKKREIWPAHEMISLKTNPSPEMVNGKQAMQL